MHEKDQPSDQPISPKSTDQAVDLPPQALADNRVSNPFAPRKPTKPTEYKQPPSGWIDIISGELPKGKEPLKVEEPPAEIQLQPKAKKEPGLFIQFLQFLKSLTLDILAALITAREKQNKLNEQNLNQPEQANNVEKGAVSIELPTYFKNPDQRKTTISSLPPSHRRTSNTGHIHP